jgi:hypothetical protein
MPRLASPRPPTQLKPSQAKPRISRLCCLHTHRDGEYFTYSYGLVFTNRLFSLILSALLVWFFERESLTLGTAPLYEYSFPSGASSARSCPSGPVNIY